MFVPFGFRFAKVQVYDIRDQGSYRELEFDLRDKRRLFFGVPNDFDLTQLEQFFTIIGLTRGPAAP
jgi:hypothetical protein